MNVEESGQSSVERQPEDSDDVCLWISDKWYIPVDRDGWCTGVCLEGALGVVVQLLPTSGEEQRLALKLPKLMGETHRENAYIADLMDKELKAVDEVLHNEGGDPEGLLGGESWELGGPMRGEIDTGKGSPGCRAWNNAIILVQFERRKTPRFCLVKKTPDPAKPDAVLLDFLPKGITNCPITTAESYDRLEQCARTKNANDETQEWGRTVFIEVGKDIGLEQPLIMSKDDALQLSPLGTTWYTCIPSVPYYWAPGTLQEAISLTKRGQEWGVREHFELAHRLCSGIDALHRNNKLHADLRPANIAYRGDAKRPERYRICDYGSFAEVGPKQKQPDPTGGTVLGPLAGTERTSVFYAPERRHGREREAADVAFIRRRNATLEIVLGWQSEIQDVDKLIRESRTTPPGAEALVSDAQTEVIHPESLAKGDRIQIRDFIFDVITATEVGGSQILQCKSRSWKIYHGRIVVENTDPFEEKWLRFPIPRSTELHQWSAATDLYGLGALFLYSVYHSEVPPLGESVGQAEERFREMLAYLEGEPYFVNIWPELESLRKTLELKLDGSADPVKSLLPESINVVQRITQTVPWSVRLVEVFGFNLGQFIFFIHFVLCCLHRQSHLKAEIPTLDEEHDRVHHKDVNEKPFCVNRCEVPTSKSGASRALTRLNKLLKDVISDKRLRALIVDKSSIPGFDPRPEPLIRASYSFLSQKSTDVVKEGKEKLDHGNTVWLAGLRRLISPVPQDDLRKLFLDLEEAVTKSSTRDFIPLISQGGTEDGTAQ